MKRKRIGVVAWKSSEHFGVNIQYLEYLNRFGTVIPLLPSNDILENLDLVVLPGGPDLSPSSLKVPPSYSNNNICPFREYFYKENLAKYIAQKTPIFGICLGFQQLNVHFNGGLIPDFPFTYSENSRTQLVDELIFTEHGEAFKKANNIFEKKIKVNSLHHQGVMENQIAPSLVPLAYCHHNFGKIYKNVEVFIHESLPIAGVQYHPEELHTDSIANTLIKNLLK